jgi:hypothetical protein
MAENLGQQTHEGITPRQEKAIAALLSEPTFGRAALAAGVGQRTLRRWMQQPEFKRALLQARRDAFGQAMGLLQRVAPMAVGTLMKVMADPSTPPHAKVAAAVAVVKLGMDVIELEDLTERIEILERQPGRSLQTGTLDNAIERWQ